MRTIIFLLLSNILFGQVDNSQFEEWDLYNGREKPVGWFCPNLCSSPACGPCDKIFQDQGDFAVKVHNVMPCVSSDNQAKSRNAGFIHDRFFPVSNHFRLSFDLIIDSIEAPSAFIMTIHGKGLPPYGLIWEIDSLISQRIEHDILLDHDYDSVYIRFESKGYLKPDAIHDCDLGYISAIIDSIETETIVNTDHTLPKPIMVYPNPFTNVLHLESRQNNISWILYDFTGHILLTGDENDIKDLDILQRGLYLIQIKLDEELYIERVVKQ